MRSIWWLSDWCVLGSVNVKLTELTVRSHSNRPHIPLLGTIKTENYRPLVCWPSSDRIKPSDGSLTTQHHLTVTCNTFCCILCDMNEPGQDGVVVRVSDSQPKGSGFDPRCPACKHPWARCPNPLLPPYLLCNINISLFLDSLEVSWYKSACFFLFNSI